ncbi:hypothetical protein BRADI_1g22904v3 [Brachypodium distachyon]|uniref:Endonuclease/exonuclease/phosphatase domain-containing protein n=1 Tax=Brachypodium distachyon TaxID=15368 RepID=A0A2K2DKN6_BRADI|nr:hypothetical protein BRADI_1g22904v3 [Brachypodium distachyon]
MNLLCWNCRGIGQPRTVQELLHLVKTHKPKIVFLSETRNKTSVIEGLRWRLGLKHMIAVPGEGKGGGLALFSDES